MDDENSGKEIERNDSIENCDEDSDSEILEPVKLTDRDIGIFRLAHEHRYIVYSQIREGFWKGRSGPAKACYKRVEKLVRSSYLGKGYSTRKSLDVYFATEKSLTILKDCGLDSGIGLYQPTPQFDWFIDHDLNVLNVRIILRRLGLDTWTSERVIRERDRPKRVPDGVLNIGGKRIAIEYECGLTKEIKRYQAMMNYYSGHESYALLFIIINGDVKDWLVRVLHYDVKTVWITTYKELLNKKEEAIFENKATSFPLSMIL